MKGGKRSLKNKGNGQKITVRRQERNALSDEGSGHAVRPGSPGHTESCSEGHNRQTEEGTSESPSPSGLSVGGHMPLHPDVTIIPQVSTYMLGWSSQGPSAHFWSLTHRCVVLHCRKQEATENSKRVK